ncbi:MAG: PEP-utilizing enzyme [Nanoarchaeota archaeon]
MIKKFLNSEDYQECFKFDGHTPFIISYDFVKAYKDLEGVAFVNKNRWYSYISLKSVEKAGKEGVKIYSSFKKYEKLKKETYKTKKKIVETYDLISNNKSGVRDFSKFFKLFNKFRELYRRTEFFYTDLAFEKMKEIPEIERNLAKFGDFKIEGRTFLNSIFFNPTSYFVKTLKVISNITNISLDKIYLYSTDEILDLIKGGKLNEKEIEERRKSYFIYSRNGKVKILSGVDAQNTIDKFVDKNISQEITGRVAHKGIVRARAKVIKVNIKNYDKMNKVVDEMKKGDVLVVETTEPSIILACNKASAIVTNQGGMMSHAAIVARELKIPCIVGTNNATEMINDGDLIEVDADKGIVRIIKRI